MGRIIPRNNPNYDHGLDLDMTVGASTAEIAAALVSRLNQKNIQVEEQTASRITFSGKSSVGMKNIWIAVEFNGSPPAVRVTSRITKAHTAGWIHLFGIPIGPRRVRGINTYRSLTTLWRSNLSTLDSVGR